MRKDFINLQNFDNVAVGKVAKTKLDIGPRYHTIWIDYKEAGSRVAEADIEGGIDEIVLKVNSIEQWRISPAKLFDLERAYNPDFSVDNGMIPIFLSNRAVEGILQQEVTALGTLGVNSVELEIHVASGATTPSLEAYAEVDYVQEAPGVIRKVQSKNVTVGATGDFKDSVSRRGVTYRSWAFFENANNDITNLRIQYEGQTLVDHEPDVIDAMIGHYGYSVASGMVFYPFDKRINGDALPSQIEQKNGQLRDASIRYTATMANADNFDFVEDFYSTPDA